VALALTLVMTPAVALAPPASRPAAAASKFNFSVGPSAGVVWREGEPSALLSLDLTWVPPVGIWPFWLSAGLRSVVDEPVGWLPYAEAGVWLHCALGAGVSTLLVQRQQPRTGGHLFVGLPLPLGQQVLDVEDFIVVEPYYRPTWLFGGEGEGALIHEAGVLVKFARLDIIEIEPWK